MKKDFYEILGITKSADAAAIKKAYRKKAIEYHPDKISSKELPDDFVLFAQFRYILYRNAKENYHHMCPHNKTSYSF